MTDRRLNEFLSKIAIAEGGCWLWTGFINNMGYGRMGDHRYAHRAAYEHWVGEVPAGLDIDHLCRTTACANPDHLEAVTRSVNLLRGAGASVARARSEAMTHCKNGHLRTPENIMVMQRIRDGRSYQEKHCRECGRQNWREYYYRKTGPVIDCRCSGKGDE